MRHLILALAAVAALSACGKAQAAAPELSPKDEIQTVLADALVTAKEYGQQNLGHYLKMDAAALKQLGLEHPANVVVKVTTDHTGYCLTAVHGGADEADPWRTASVDSKLQSVEPGDSCGGR